MSTCGSFSPGSGTSLTGELPLEPLSRCAVETPPLLGLARIRGRVPREGCHRMLTPDQPWRRQYCECSSQHGHGIMADPPIWVRWIIVAVVGLSPILTFGMATALGRYVARKLRARAWSGYNAPGPAGLARHQQPSGDDGRGQRGQRQHQHGGRHANCAVTELKFTHGSPLSGRAAGWLAQGLVARRIRSGPRRYCTRSSGKGHPPGEPEGRRQYQEEPDDWAE